MSRLRTALGLALSLLLIAVIALFALFLTRESVLWPVVAARAPALVRDVLGLPIGVEAIHGNPFHQLGLEGVSIDRTADLPGLPQVEDLDVELAFDLGQLVAGDFDGLRAVRAHARRVVVQLGAGPDAPEEELPASDPWDIAEVVPRFWGILANGALVEVDDLSVHTADGAVLGAGPARVRLTPRPRRRVLVTWTDTVTVELLLTRDGLFHLEASVVDPMQKLRASGLEIPLEGGRVRLSAEGDLGSRDLGGSLRWTGADLRERGPSAFRAEVRVRGEFAQANATADLPGLVVQAHDLGLALADVRTALEAARGSIDVRVSDLEPWRALLPEPALDWLPITASLRANLDADGLDVRYGAVRARGLDVTIDRGRLPLRIDGDLRRARGSIQARIEAPDPVRIAASGTEVRFAGNAVVGVEGTIDEPTIRGRVALREVVAFGHAADRLEASVRMEGDSIQIDEAMVRGARPLEIARGLDAALAGTVTMAPNALTVSTKLHASGAWPEAVAHFAPEAAEFAPRLVAGELDVVADLEFAQGSTGLPLGRLQAAWRGPEASPTELDVRAVIEDGESGAAVELDLDGEIAPDWLAALLPDTPLASMPEPVAFQVTATGEIVDLSPRGVTAVVDLSGRDPSNAAPWQVGLAASWPDPSRIELHHLTVCGPFEARVSGSVPLESEGRTLEIAFAADVRDARDLSPWLGAAAPEVQLRLHGALHGSIERPSAELAVDADAPDLSAFLGEASAFEGALPASLRARLRAVDGEMFINDFGLEAGTGDETASLDLHGRAPLRVGASGVESAPGLVSGALTAQSRRLADAPISASVPILWDERALWIPELEVRTPLSKIEGQARVAEPSQVFRGTAPADLDIEGSLELWQFDVTRLPGTLLPAPILGGVIDAVLSVEGTARAPAVAGIVTVAQGRAKVANDVPTLDAVEAQLDLSKDLIEVTRLRANVGSGSVEAQGTITAAGAPTLLAAGNRAQVDLAVRAREAVFLRGTGKSLRANSDVTVKGSLERLDITGEVVVLSGTIINRISLVPDFATRGGAPVGAGLRLFEIPPPLGDALRFDIAVRTKEPLDVVTHVFNAPMSASFSLQGSGAAPFLNGAVSTTQGTLRLPAMSLDVRQALITFVPDEPTRPRILVRADTRRHGVDVSLTATGPADAPEFLLSSLPPLTQQELFVLISTGVLPDTLQRQGLAGRASAVGSYLAEEIINFYFGSESTEAGESLADRIHVFSGREISRKGVESIVVDVDIWNGLALEGERDIYQDFNMGVLYRVRF